MATRGARASPRLSRRERLLFEAGIKLGGVFHQYIGIPVDRATAAALSRSIEGAVRLQPFVRQVRVRIDPGRGGPVGRGRFAYRYLTPEMLRVSVRVADGVEEVEAVLAHRPDLRYPLMEVARVGRTRRAANAAGRSARTAGRSRRRTSRSAG
jgi:dihydroneopterin aldolase